MKSQEHIGVFHPGTQHSWQTAYAFQEVGALRWYATSVFYDPGKWPYRVESVMPGWLAHRIHNEFARRSWAALDVQKVRQLGVAEWIEAGLYRLRLRSAANAVNRMGNASFGAKIIKLIEKEPVSIIWGYGSSSLEVFRWAKKRGIRCILDQTIGHSKTENEIMREEKEKNSEYFLDSFQFFDEEWINRQNEGLALADRVIVGSEYCANTLVANGCERRKIVVVPYGYDEKYFPSIKPPRSPIKNRQTKLLFVGQLTPRKGIAYLLKAYSRIKSGKAELSLVGRLDMPDKVFRKSAGNAAYAGQVPRSELKKHFLQADLFVFPSLFEGGGIVLYEANGAGLGIIQTERCGDGVRKAESGIVLKEISVDSVQEAIEYAVSNPDWIESAQEYAWGSRRQRNWQEYRNTIRQELMPL